MRLMSFRTIAVVLLIALSQGASAEETLTHLLANANTTGASKLSSTLLSRLRRTGAPIIEGAQVTFIVNYSGSDSTPSVAGDWSGWRTLPMKRLSNTDLWWRTEPFPSGARMEYKVTTGRDLMVDPLNPRKTSNGLGGENSVFETEGYQRETRIEHASVPYRGRMETLAIARGTTAPAREVSIYLPAEYDAEPGRRFPVLYLHDGNDYLRLCHAAEIAENLIADGRIEPIILVFVPPANRMLEYWRESAKFSEFFISQVIPAVDKRYRTIPSSAGRAVGGASLGGLISFRMVIDRPDIYGRVLSQSGSFWVESEMDEKKLANRAKIQGRLWLDYGTYESELTTANNHLVATLRAKHTDAKATIRPTAHNWTAWRDRFADALIWLFPRNDALTLWD